MVFADSLHRRAPLLIFGFGALALSIVLVLLFSKRSAARVGEVEGGNEVSYERGEDRALRTAPSEEEREALNGEAAKKEVPVAADELVNTALLPLEYGVTGSIQCRGEWLHGRVVGTVRAVNSEGVVSSDECSRGFQLYGLEPGWWVIEVDLQANGRAESSVVLTEEQPEVELELWVERAIGHVIAVEFRIAKPDPSAARSYRPPSLLVVGHDAALGGPKTTFTSLEPLCHAYTWLSSHRARSEMWGSANLSLSTDRPLTLSLFTNGLWIASRERSVGEDRVEWQLSSEQWPPPPGVLEVNVVDATDGATLNLFIKTVDWRGVPVSSGESLPTRFDDVPPGWRQVEVGGGHHERVRRWIFVPPAGEAHETIRLRAAVELAGRVTDQDGDPAMITVACWRALDGGLVDPESYRTCRSGPDGEFLFTSLGPGRYLIRSVDDEQRGGPSTIVGEFVASRFLEVQAPTSRDGLRLQLELVSTLLLARSQPINGALDWSIEDSDGRQLRSGKLHGLAPHAVRLPPGRYKLIVSGDGRDSFSQWLDLREEPQRIDL